jgi:LPS sulfotransferase NodH
LHVSAQRQHPVVQALGGDRCRGESDSYFHRPSISDWLADLGVTREGSVPQRELLEAIFRTAIAKGTLNTGIFGLRLQRDSFDFSPEGFASPTTPIGRSSHELI